MKIDKMIQVLLAIMMLANIGCEKSSATDEIIATKIVQFSLQCGETNYKGVINEETKEILVEGIIDGKAITDVSYQLSLGATITPEPKKVKQWNNTQIFTVSSGTNQSVQYTLNLPDLKPLSPVDRKAVIGYMPLSDWEFETQYPKTKWQYLTHINVSFALVKKDGSLDLSKVSERIIQVRDDARKYGVKTLISLAKMAPGEFTAAISDPVSRASLVKNIIEFTRDNQLDGFDIDYEEYDNWDRNLPALLEFIRALYEAKEDTMLMTCAVVGQWLNYTTEWQQYFDYINIMSYDKGSFTAIPAQHAAYEEFVKDMQWWATVAKAPKDKIVGGLPFYGYSWDPELPGDDVRAIRFHSIVDKFAGAEEKDMVGNKIYYNGKPTIRSKCNFVMENDFGGVMIWQLFQDAYQDEKRLMEVVGHVMLPE